MNVANKLTTGKRFNMNYGRPFGIPEPFHSLKTKGGGTFPSLNIKPSINQLEINIVKIDIDGTDVIRNGFVKMTPLVATQILNWN